VWDNPRLLDATARVLVALAVLIFAYCALQLLLRSPLFPLRDVVLLAEPRNASRVEIANALEGVGGNFFAADLAEVRARLERVGWVRSVEARRVWPDRIEVRLEEHVAFARWAGGGLVNRHGEPFSAPLEDEEQARLPLLAGPAGTEGELARRHRVFSGLLAPLGLAPEHGALVSLVLTPRHAWRLRLSGGLELELGRDGAEPVEARLARFVAAYPESIGRLPRAGSGAEPPRHVDLRYPNGFALRVAGWRG
jgi:cell division protein FtsQ